MKLDYNKSLKKYNTFGIDVKTKIFCVYNGIEDVQYLIKKNIIDRNTKILVLGGGSNLLFTNDFDGIIIYPQNKKISIEKQTADNIFLKVEAGKTWDEFVDYCVEKGYGGVENLSGIPGNVGASAVQNIGAYGVEVKDVIHKVHVINLSDGTEKTLTNSECEFGYRSSVFKNKFKDKFLVDSVVFKLQKKPIFKTEYGSIQQELQEIEKVDLQTLRQIIINIRNNKLPDPQEIGNAGSFFKNPIIENEQAEILKNKYPEIVYYTLPSNRTKIAAGWLIEKAGMKGFISENGRVGVHPKQALVIVNRGNASGQDVSGLAKLIQQKVLNKFGIQLESEVIFV